jgi:formylglycine-generating enzyme required for sulfatase activity
MAGNVYEWIKDYYRERDMMQERFPTCRARNGVPVMLFAAALSCMKHSSSGVLTGAPTIRPFREPTLESAVSVR